MQAQEAKWNQTGMWLRPFVNILVENPWLLQFSAQITALM